jgi:hypothetical protein
MANILNVIDIVNSIKTIEENCKMVDGYGVKNPDPDYEKFYERVKGLMSLVEENLSNKKGGGVMG